MPAEKTQKNTEVGEKNKEEVLSRGPARFPVLNAAPSQNIPLVDPAAHHRHQKKQGINKRNCGADWRRHERRLSTGFQGKARGGRNLFCFCLSFKWELMIPGLQALLVIGVLISCEN